MPTWFPETGLVFIHPPKTGSTWTSKVLQRRGGHRSHQHDAPWTLASTDQQQTLVSTSRDPWSWYASLWQHCQSNATLKSLLRTHLGGRQGDFKQFLRIWTHPQEDRRELVRFTPIWTPDAHGRSKEKLLTSGLGLWSWACTYFYGSLETWGVPDNFEWGIDVLLDHSRLTEGLGAVLQEDLHSEVGPQSDRVSGMPESYQDWYDEEMLEWIREKDGWGLDLLGYEQAGGASNLPVMCFLDRGGRGISSEGVLQDRTWAVMPQKPTPLEENIQRVREFATQSGEYEGVYFDFGRIFMAKNYRTGIGDCLDLAIIKVKEELRGQGYFTRFLEGVEELCDELGLVVFIEWVNAPRFQSFWLRRGYSQIEHAPASQPKKQVTSFYRPLPDEDPP